MHIFSVDPVGNSGRHVLRMNWHGKLPPGYVETTIDPEEFYAFDGFVIPAIENGKVTAIMPNIEAKSAWQSTQPKQIRADIDFIAALQGVNL